MSEDEYREISRALGQLEGTVRALMDQWGRQDSHATQSRQQMYQKLEMLTQQIDRVANDAENIQQDVAELRNDIDDKVMPVIERVRAEWEQKLGAKGVLFAIWTAIGIVGTAIGYSLNALIQYLRLR